MEGSETALPTKLEMESVARGGEAMEMVPYDVVLEEASHLHPFVGWLRQKGINVAAEGGKRVRVFLLEDSPVLAEISALTEWVERIEPYVAPEIPMP